MSKTVEYIQAGIVGGMLGSILKTSGIILFSFQGFLIFVACMSVWCILDIVRNSDV